MTEQDYLLIETYLQGELSAQDAADLETRAAGEPDFAAALAERRLLNDYLRADSLEPDLRRTLDQLGNEYFTDTGGVGEAPKLRAVTDDAEGAETATVRELPGRNLRKWLYPLTAVAAVALVIILALPLLFPGGASYSDWDDHQPLALTLRSDTIDAAADAQTAYNAGDYGLAVRLLRTYLQNPDANPQARLALGISLLETDRDDEAVTVFTELADGGGTLAPYANWYLALAAVKRGDDAAARTFLDRIPETDAYLTERVKRLRESL